MKTMKKGKLQQRSTYNVGAIVDGIFKYDNNGTATVEIFENGSTEKIPKGSYESTVKIPKGSYGMAQCGDTVRTCITRVSYSKKSYKLKGKVIEVIHTVSSEEKKPKTIPEIYDFPEDFNKTIKKEAKGQYYQNEKIIKNRVDHTDEEIITCDPIDAKDFDDAIGIKYDEKNKLYIIGVHIAAVYDYVNPEKTPSLYERAKEEMPSSIYIPGMVFPMLPKIFSNDLCSLKQGCIRPTLSLYIKIDKKGQIVDFYMERSIIKVKYNLNYNEYQCILDGDKETCDKYADICPLLKNLEKVHDLLAIKDAERGKMNIKSSETKVELANNDEVKRVYRKESNKAMEIVETFMVLANSIVGEMLFQLEAPAIYRNHTTPDPEKAYTLQGLMYGKGICKEDESYSAMGNKFYKFVTDRIKGRKDEFILANRTIRSLNKAKYEPISKGHFGLALEHYMQWTSPIRRFGDLHNHRVINLYLEYNFNPPKSKIMKLKEEAKSCVAKLNNFESKVRDIEDSINSLYISKYMENFVGQHFNAMIFSINENGIVVELDSSIRGFIEEENVDQDLLFYEDYEKLIDEQSGKEYMIGTEVEVELQSAKVEIHENGMPWGRLDFKLIS